MEQITFYETTKHALTNQCKLKESGGLAGHKRTLGFRMAKLYGINFQKVP